MADVRRHPGAHAVARRHPAATTVPGRLEPRPRLADRVPGSRLRRRRLHRQRPRDDPRALDADGTVLWRHDTQHGKMAASPAVVGDELVVHGMDGHRPRARPPRPAACAGRSTSARRSSRSPLVRDRIDYFGAWNGNVYALDLRTHRLRWIYPLGLQDHLERRARRRHALHRRLRRPAARARARQRAAALAARRSTAGSTARRPSGPGSVFVPSSDGGSLTAFSTRGRYLWRSPHGRIRLLVAGGLGRARLLRLVQRRLYSVSARTGRVALGGADGRAGLRRARVVDGVAYAGSFAHRIVGVDARSGRVLLDFPHGEYVPVSGSGGRLLLHGYSRLYAVEATRSPRPVRMTAGRRHRAAGTARARSSTASG